MEVWKVGKTFLIQRSSSILWEMIVSDVTCMKIEYIRLKHAKWMVWSFNIVQSCELRRGDDACLPEQVEMLLLYMRQCHGLARASAAGYRC
ncbi:hypothetical protein LDENG_00275660 [Lucifuga dentata]|nr:hypothetical protein LDENG_00275660 [Lucifuga dentata]